MAYEFDEGLAPVTLNMRTGYVSRSGELVISETPIRIVLADLFAELDRV